MSKYQRLISYMYTYEGLAEACDNDVELRSIV